MTSLMTSPAGVAFLERHEGVVTKAYRDPAGVWTIGAGLTAASGVVTPRAGMTITKAEASRLLTLALNRNYEPAVARAMPEAVQHEFDGAVSFHFNTGAIAKASWVKSWKADDWPEVARRIKLWNKGGGRVLPGLVRRRDEEFNLIAHGDYGFPSGGTVRVATATFVVPVTDALIAEVRKGLTALGYEPGARVSAINFAAVAKFQAKHDLVVDGKIGRATLSTLQRMLDARTAAAAPAATAAVGGAAEIAQPAATDAVVLPDWLGWAVLAVGLIWMAWRLWAYRDAVAARIQGAAPGLAVKLRSF